MVGIVFVDNVVSTSVVDNVVSTSVVEFGVETVGIVDKISQ